MILGRLIYRLLKQHQWGHAYSVPLKQDTFGLLLREKQCKRCGLIALVKTRARKAP